MSANNRKLALACEGKSASQGGMNLPELRRALRKNYPQHSNKFQTMTRREITNFCKKNTRIKKDVRSSQAKYFLENIPLTERQKKYCRCVAKVASKNNEWCYTHNMWKKPPSRRSRSSRRGACYNPYAVCTKSVGSENRPRACLKYMDLERMPKEEVRALAKLKGVSASTLKRKVAKE